MEGAAVRGSRVQLKRGQECPASCLDVLGLTLTPRVRPYDSITSGLNAHPHSFLAITES